ncbi:MAG: hypothetical protein DRN04_19285 [Thermoprotei archaeon]|nr:MAG: hypothetical protein DRN04_19285 [Thermoprotei archaeon]
MVKIYKVTLKALSPLIISKRMGFKGFSYEVEKYIIHGSIVRGALLTKMLEEGEDPITVNRLALSPDYAITPFLATLNEKKSLYINSNIAHSLCFRTKKKIKGVSPVFSLDIENIVSKIRNKTPLEDILAEVFEKHSLKLAETKKTWLMPGETKTCSGSVIVEENRLWFIPSISSNVSIEVGLDHTRGSSAPGMLYAYEHVCEGTVYTGYITVSDNSPLNTILSKRELILSIGRGTTRGFGKVLATAEEIGFNKIKSNISKNLHKLEEPYIALEAVSPVFKLDPLPLPLREKDTVTISSEWLNKLGLPQDYEAEFEIIGILGGYYRYQGWSMRNKAPKLPVKGLSPGSLILAKIKSMKGDPLETLSLLPLIGLDNFASLGFNLVFPLQKDFIQIKPWEVKL